MKNETTEDGLASLILQKYASQGGVILFIDAEHIANDFRYTAKNIALKRIIDRARHGLESP